MRTPTAPPTPGAQTCEIGAWCLQGDIVTLPQRFVGEGEPRSCCVEHPFVPRDPAPAKRWKLSALHHPVHDREGPDADEEPGALVSRSAVRIPSAYPAKPLFLELPHRRGRCLFAAKAHRRIATQPRGCRMTASSECQRTSYSSRP